MNGKIKKMFGKKVAKVLSIFLSCAVAVSSFAPVVYATDGAEVAATTHDVTYKLVTGGSEADSEISISQGSYVGIRFYDGSTVVDVGKVSVKTPLANAGFELQAFNYDENTIEVVAKTATDGDHYLHFEIDHGDGTVTTLPVKINVDASASTPEVTPSPTPEITPSPATHNVTHQIFMGSGNMCEVPAVGTTADVTVGDVFAVRFYDNGELIDISKITVSQEGLAAAGFEVANQCGCGHIDLRATEAATVGEKTLYFTINFDDGSMQWPKVQVNVVESDGDQSSTVDGITMNWRVADSEWVAYEYRNGTDAAVDVTVNDTVYVKLMDSEYNTITPTDYFVFETDNESGTAGINISTNDYGEIEITFTEEAINGQKGLVLVNDSTSYPFDFNLTGGKAISYFGGTIQWADVTGVENGAPVTWNSISNYSDINVDNSSTIVIRFIDSEGNRIVGDEWSWSGTGLTFSPYWTDENGDSYQTYSMNGVPECTYAFTIGLENDEIVKFNINTLDDTDITFWYYDSIAEDYVEFTSMTMLRGNTIEIILRDSNGNTIDNEYISNIQVIEAGGGMDIPFEITENLGVYYISMNDDSGEYDWYNNFIVKFKVNDDFESFFLYFMEDLSKIFPQVITDETITINALTGPSDDISRQDITGSYFGSRIGSMLGIEFLENGIPVSLENVEYVKGNSQLNVNIGENTNYGIDISVGSYALEGYYHTATFNVNGKTATVVIHVSEASGDSGNDIPEDTFTGKVLIAPQTNADGTIAESDMPWWDYDVYMKDSGGFATASDQIYAVKFTDENGEVISTDRVQLVSGHEMVMEMYVSDEYKALSLSDGYYIGNYQLTYLIDNQYYKTINVNSQYSVVTEWHTSLEENVTVVTLRDYRGSFNREFVEEDGDVLVMLEGENVISSNGGEPVIKTAGNLYFYNGGSLTVNFSSQDGKTTAIEAGGGFGSYGISDQYNVITINDIGKAELVDGEIVTTCYGANVVVGEGHTALNYTDLVIDGDFIVNNAVGEDWSEEMFVEWANLTAENIIVNGNFTATWDSVVNANTIQTGLDLYVACGAVINLEDNDGEEDEKVGIAANNVNIINGTVNVNSINNMYHENIGAEAAVYANDEIYIEYVYDMDGNNTVPILNVVNRYGNAVPVYAVAARNFSMHGGKTDIKALGYNTTALYTYGNAADYDYGVVVHDGELNVNGFNGVLSDKDIQLGNPDVGTAYVNIKANNGYALAVDTEVGGRIILENAGIVLNGSEGAIGARYIPVDTENGVYDFGYNENVWVKAGTSAEDATVVFDFEDMLDCTYVETAEPDADAKVEIAFNTNGGHYAINSLTKVIGNVYGKLPVPVKLGYKFVGWTSDEAGENFVSESDRVKEGGALLYAQWEAGDANTLYLDGVDTNDYVMAEDADYFIFSYINTLTVEFTKHNVINVPNSAFSCGTLSFNGAEDAVLTISTENYYSDVIFTSDKLTFNGKADYIINGRIFSYGGIEFNSCNVELYSQSEETAVMSYVWGGDTNGDIVVNKGAVVSVMSENGIAVLADGANVVVNNGGTLGAQGKTYGVQATKSTYGNGGKISVVKGGSLVAMGGKAAMDAETYSFATAKKMVAGFSESNAQVIKNYNNERFFSIGDYAEVGTEVIGDMVINGYRFNSEDEFEGYGFHYVPNTEFNGETTNVLYLEQGFEFNTLNDVYGIETYIFSPVDLVIATEDESTITTSVSGGGEDSYLIYSLGDVTMFFVTAGDRNLNVRAENLLLIAEASLTAKDIVINGNVNTEVANLNIYGVMDVKGDVHTYGENIDGYDQINIAPEFNWSGSKIHGDLILQGTTLNTANNLRVYGDVLLKGAAINAKSEDEYSQAHLMVDGAFTVNNFSEANIDHLTAGDVVVNGMGALEADRVSAENVTVYEFGTINTYSPSGYSSLYVGSKLNVNGGNLKVIGGIETYELNMTDGSIVVLDTANGIDLGKMTMTGGYVDIDAAGNGIILRNYGKTSAISVTGGQLDVDAGEYAVYLTKGTKATINSSKNKTAAKLRLCGNNAAVYTGGTLTAYGDLTAAYWYDGLETVKKYNGETYLYVNVKTHYDVTFHRNNGQEDYVMKVRLDDTSPELYAEKSGFTFNGWYIDEECTVPYDFTTPVTEDIDLYAGWVSHKYTLHANGGKFVDGDTAAEEFVVNVPYYGLFEDQYIPTPLRANSTFTGWYTDAECTVPYEYGVAATEDAVLYAGWVYKYTVSDVVATVVPGDADREAFEIVYFPAEMVESEEYYYNLGVKLGDRIVLKTATHGAVIKYALVYAEQDLTEESYKVYTGPIEITEALLGESGYDYNGELMDPLGLFVYATKEEYNNSASSYALILADTDRDEWGDVLEEDRAEFTDALDIPDFMWVANVPVEVEYTGTAIKADEMRVYDNKTLLTLNKDYTVTYKNNTKAGTAAITIKGKGNYADTLTETFTITAMEIDGTAQSGAVFEAQLNATVKTFNNKVQKPTVKLLKDGKALKSNTDYTVTYEMYDETTGEWSVVTGPKEVGEYRVVLKGKGNYSGVVYADYTITANVLASALSVSGVKAANYTGEAIEQNITVKHGKTVLVEGEHYTVTYRDNTNVGTATVVITAVEGSGYEGEKEVTFKINGTKLTAGMIKGFASNVAYNGGEHKQDGMYLVNKKVTLTEGVDYEVVYENNTVSGTAKVTITGVNGYTGAITKTFTIGTKLAANMLKDFKSSVKYFEAVDEFGYVEQPGDRLEVTVKVDGVNTKLTLEEGVDYIATYTNNDKAGTATVVYEGTGAYYGNFKKTFKIAATAFSTKLMTVENWTDAVTYTGSNIEQSGYELYYNDTLLAEGVDYTVTYKNNLKAGKATVTFKGMTGYSGSYSQTFVINKVDAADVAVDMPTETVYTKGATTPEPVITYGDVVLKKGTDYTVSYKNNTKQGTATATITLKGNYTGKVAHDYTITQSSLENVTITAADKVFSNKVNAYKVTPKLVDTNNKALSAGTDYDKVFVYAYEEDVQLANGVVRHAGETVGAKDIVPAGSIIRVTVQGKGNYADTASVTYRVTQGTVTSASVTIEAQNYTGRPVELDKNQITVKVGKVELDNDDYEIIGYTNNTKIGTAKVTIKGVGDYGGTKTVTFKIQAKSAKTVIKFMANGGNGSVASVNVMNDDVQLTSIFNSKGKQTLTRKGYEFIGWNTEKDGTGVQYDNADIFLAEDRGDARTIRLYAQWQIVEYKIEYVLGADDAVNNNPATYTVDTATFNLENPERDGYKFAGWYTNANLKSGKTTKIAQGSTGDKVFYAKWTAI